MPMSRGRSAVCPRVAIATEGPASEAVLREIGRRAGWIVVARSTEGKNKLMREFPKMLASAGRDCDAFLVAPDLQPGEDCGADAAEWRSAIAAGFPRARLCLAIWETEAWLLADPAAFRSVLGFAIELPNPDYIGGEKPSALIEAEYWRHRGHRRGLGFDKRTDGAAIARAMDLNAARAKSGSLDHFLRSA